MAISPDLLLERCDDLSDWTVLNPYAVIDPAGQFKLYTDFADAKYYAVIRKYFSSAITGDFTVQLKTYFDSIGAAGGGENKSSYFYIVTGNGKWYEFVQFGTDGLTLLNGNIPDVVKCNASAAWQEWRFEVDFDAGQVEVFLKEEGESWESKGEFDCDWAQATSSVNFIQYGYITAERLSYLDYIYIGSGHGEIVDDQSVYLQPEPFTARAALTCAKAWQEAWPVSPFIGRARLSVAHAHPSALMVSPFAIRARLSILDVFPGGTIFVCPAFRALADMEAFWQLGLAPDAFRARAALSLEKQIFAPPVCGPFAALAILDLYKINIFPRQPYTIGYVCVLSGAPDLFLPMAFFQAYLRADGESVVDVVIPGLEYLSAIVERAPEDVAVPGAVNVPVPGFIVETAGPDDQAAVATRWLEPAPPPPPASDQSLVSLGNLSVYMVRRFADRNYIQKLIISASLDADGIRVDEGAVEKSVTLQAHGILPAARAKTVVLTGAQKEDVRLSKSRWCCAPDYNARPGDSIEIEGQVFSAGVIWWRVMPGEEVMEIWERE